MWKLRLGDVPTGARELTRERSTLRILAAVIVAALLCAVFLYYGASRGPDRSGPAPGAQPSDRRASDPPPSERTSEPKAEAADPTEEAPARSYPESVEPPKFSVAQFVAGVGEPFLDWRTDLDPVELQLFQQMSRGKEERTLVLRASDARIMLTWVKEDSTPQEAEDAVLVATLSHKIYEEQKRYREAELRAPVGSSPNCRWFQSRKEAEGIQGELTERVEFAVASSMERYHVHQDGATIAVIDMKPLYTDPFFVEMVDTRMEMIEAGAIDGLTSINYSTD